MYEFTDENPAVLLILGELLTQWLRHLVPAPPLSPCHDAAEELHKLLGITSNNTTAYHPQANGMVERMHRQLKGALKARLHDSSWMNELPIVMLGLRTALREDAGCSPAELVYGTDLHLPGEMFETPRTDALPPGYLQDLKETMRNVLPPPTAYHGTRSTYSPTNLGHTGWVYVRSDGHRTPLQRPFTGPFKVIETGSKFFRIDIKGKEEHVSVDRLKTAYKDNDIFTHLNNE